MEDGAYGSSDFFLMYVCTCMYILMYICVYIYVCILSLESRDSFFKQN